MLFRGLEVGTVTGMTLGTLSDRVMIAMRISKRYQHLVRNNSVFWLASGYSLDFGLTGVVVKTGTFNQFIRGGIAFATPPGTPLAPKAQKANTSCCRKVNRKSGVNGELRFPNNAHCSGVPARAFMLNSALFFASGTCSWPNTPFISDAFSDTNARSLA